MTSRLLNSLSHLVVAVEVEYIRDEIQGILVVLNLSVEAGEVEPVSEIIFIDLTEIFVATRRDKLRIYD